MIRCRRERAGFNRPGFAGSRVGRSRGVLSNGLRGIKLDCVVDVVESAGGEVRLSESLPASHQSTGWWLIQEQVGGRVTRPVTLVERPSVDKNATDDVVLRDTKRQSDSATERQRGSVRRRGCRRTGRSARKGLAGKMVVGLSCWTSTTVTFALGVDRSSQQSRQEHFNTNPGKTKANPSRRQPAPAHCHQEPATDRKSVV